MARMTNTSFMTGIKNWVLGKIANIMALIPNQASSSNQLADKNFVNSSIATATATFRGTYNVVSDLSLSYNATHAQIEAALVMKMAALSIVVDNNDYAFVQIPTSDATPTEIAKIEKYKYNGTVWAFEYELNNSGFTAAQWAAINSGATLELIGKLSALPTNAELITILNSKASKAANPTAGHLASLDGSGNPTDSGVGIEDNGAYDVTLHNNNAKFASLSELLNSANLNTLIPVDKRYGGMSIKFVQSSDNKYVQFRYMGTAVTGNPYNPFLVPANWQGVDTDPTPNSRNLVESGGVHDIKTVSLIHSFDEENIIVGKYVNSSGQIGSSSQRYRLIKFHLDKGNYRFLNNKWNEIFGLWKYSDSEYSQDATKITISSYDEVLSLDSAYYILYWYSTATDATIIPNEFVVYNMDYITNEISDKNDLVTSFDVFDKIIPSAIIDIPAQNGYRYSYPIKSGYTYVFYYISGSGAGSIRAGKVDKSTVELFGSISSSSPKHEYTATDDYIFLQFNAAAPLKIGVYRKESIEGRVFSLEEQAVELNAFKTNVKDRLPNIDGNILNINITPESGQSVGSWVRIHTLTAGTYLIDNAVESYTSFNLYDANNNVLYSAGSLPRGEVTKVTISTDAVRITGYSPNVDVTIDISIVKQDSIEQRLEVLEDEEDIKVLNPASIYDTLLQNNVRSRRIDGNTKKIFSLVHFSDIHGLENNVLRIENYMKRYSECFDDIICTGDIVSDVFTNANILANFPSILTVLGNHDAWVRIYNENIVERQESENIWVVKQKNCYDKFIKDNVSNWSVTQPLNAAVDGKCYYYKDYVDGSTKLRLIVLDCMHYNVGADLDGNNNSIQNAWLDSVLSDARQNNIPVVIANHYWPKWVDIANPEVIKCSYTNTDNIGGDYLPTIVIDSVQDFIDNGGEFVCWIVGHSHMDVIAAPRDYPKQMFIAVDCATYFNSIGNSARVKNTKSQDCFNIVAFDTHDKLVKVVRVGSDTTRQLKQKRVLAYRYAPFTDAAGVLHNIGLELSE